MVVVVVGFLLAWLLLTLSVRIFFFSEKTEPAVAAAAATAKSAAAAAIEQALFLCIVVIGINRSDNCEGGGRTATELLLVTVVKKVVREPHSFGQAQIEGRAVQRPLTKVVVFRWLPGLFCLLSVPLPFHSRRSTNSLNVFPGNVRKTCCDTELHSTAPR